MKEKSEGLERMRHGAITVFGVFLMAWALSALGCLSHLQPRNLDPTLDAVDQALEVLERDFNGGASITYPDAEEPEDNRAAVDRRWRMIREARASLKEARKP